MTNPLENFTYRQPAKAKIRFHASDYSKPILDLYFKFKGIEETNPVTWQQVLRFGAGKGVELEALNILKQNGLVGPNYSQDEHGGFKMTRENVEISGYMDAIHVDGCPIEIKSINNKNAFDIQKYRNNNPRENYVGQLAIYMDYLQKDKGYLFVISMDGLDTFWLECNRMPELGARVYKCGTVIVNLDQEYAKWSKLYHDYVLKDTEPSPWQYTYKKNIEKIDWSSISDADISKARNGHKVIGDWEILYSPYKSLIIEKQGSTFGYSLDELTRIKEITKGYSSKK